jgi:hypothetical protein
VYLRPLPAAPEDRQLVAQHDDLKLPLTTTAGEHADEAAQEPVQQDISKTRSLNRPRRDHPHGRPGRNRISLPHTYDLATQSAMFQPPVTTPWGAFIRTSCKSTGFGTRLSLCTPRGV